MWLTALISTKRRSWTNWRPTIKTDHTSLAKEKRLAGRLGSELKRGMWKWMLAPWMIKGKEGDLFKKG